MRSDALDADFFPGGPTFFQTFQELTNEISRIARMNTILKNHANKVWLGPWTLK